MFGFLESIGLGFLYRVAKDAGGPIFRRFRGMSSEDRIALRQKWKPKFDSYTRANWADRLREDAIIRDVKRIDEYPESNADTKGISPWFRIGLVGTYHRGIYVGLRWSRLLPLGDGKYRALDVLNPDRTDKHLDDECIKVMLIGLVPFENIEDVDFEGDELYAFPHVYCHFSNRREPYERVAFFTKNQLFEDALPHYTEIVDQESVFKETKKAGISRPNL